MNCELKWTELTCTKLTKLHDALLVTHASASRSWLAAVRELEFCSVQFICCEHALSVFNSPKIKMSQCTESHKLLAVNHRSSRYISDWVQFATTDHSHSLSFSFPYLTVSPYREAAPVKPSSTLFITPHNTLSLPAAQNQPVSQIISFLPKD